MLRRLLPAAAIAAHLLQPAAAQEFEIPDVSYPALAPSAPDARGFVPAGWDLETELKGDLDKDGSDDIVLVLRARDPANIISPEWSEEVKVDTNPRILAAALRTKDGYRLLLENHKLIPRVTSSTQSDPLSEVGGVAIDRGSLKVDIYYFSSGGGSDAGVCSYRFRLVDGTFRLIGYDRDNTQRMTGDTTVTSVNFLTGRMITKTGNIETDAVKTATRKLPKRPLPEIGKVGEGCMFDPEG